MNPISSTNVSPTTAGLLREMSPSVKDQPAFKNFLLDALNEVNNLQVDADRAVEKVFTGGDVNPAEVLTAVQKADMSFRMMMQVRNKIVEAYKEISRSGM